MSPSKITKMWDFPSVPVVKNPSPNAEDVGSVSDWRATCHRAAEPGSTLQLERSQHSAMRDPRATAKTRCSQK